MSNLLITDTGGGKQSGRCLVVAVRRRSSKAAVVRAAPMFLGNIGMNEQCCALQLARVNETLNGYKNNKTTKQNKKVKRRRKRADCTIYQTNGLKFILTFSGGCHSTHLRVNSASTLEVIGRHSVLEQCSLITTKSHHSILR
ncbi:uncharacterized protein [Rhodnius prolixus]|uniref:uncharacterized protein n=1 Tax=Rhodnius prolixus TaxID=13249 RepID=UPI003D18CDE8